MRGGGVKGDDRKREGDVGWELTLAAVWAEVGGGKKQMLKDWMMSIH